MTFEEAFQRTVGHEGGFQKDPNDRGNWTGGAVGAGTLKGTKYGVSAASYPSEDIEHLTLQRAFQIYKQDFWGPAGCDLVPDQVKPLLFDIAVHTSAPRAPRTAIKLLQQALRVPVDGIIGPVTMQAVYHAHPYRLAMRLQGHYLDYLNDNEVLWARYGRGWAQRVAENLKGA